ncbi:MAG: ABC transporter ATP-binding protein, partial [Spirochaetes bacterium]
MAGIGVKINEVTKKFGRVTAVDNLSLDIKPGELFTLLGPSGCGKTTLLRTIAGFYFQNNGSIFFDKHRIDTLPPHKRDTGMVFQSYAVFPFMNVFDNVAYGLKARGVPKKEINERVSNAIELVRLTGMEKRRPDQLSGGQQQRVAVARAVVIEPRVLLMDEPLSNLDAKLRVDMRVDIKRLQRKLGTTMIYVTHDQEEALAISD